MQPEYRIDDHGVWWRYFTKHGKITRERALLYNCKECEKEFPRLASIVKRKKNGPFCSKTCASKHAFRRRYPSGYNGVHAIRWSGGRRYDNGYVRVWVPEHPRVGKNAYVFEHILVMEKVIGRHLLQGENVHHKNGVRDDNRPENLELWSVSQPCGQRVADKVAWAQEILRTYAPLIESGKL